MPVRILRDHPAGFEVMAACRHRLTVVTLIIFALAGISGASADTIDDVILKLLEGEDPSTRQDVLPPTRAKPGTVPGTVAKDAGPAVTLADIERPALDQDPRAKAAQERAISLEEQSQAALRLPDPRLRIGVNEYPTAKREDGDDSYRLVLGLQQEVMPRSRRTAESSQMEKMGEAQVQQAAKEKLTTLLELRKAWINVYTAHHSVVIIRQTQKLMQQMQQVMQIMYRTGGGSQSETLMAQLELSQLKDQESAMETDREMALAELAKWSGPSVLGRSLALDSLDFPPLPDRAKLEAGLEKHPSYLVMKLEADAANLAVDVARSKSDPGWMFEVEAMWMNSSAEGIQNDNASAYLTIELPFFKKNLQDRWIAASEKEYNSALFLASDERRDLKRMLEQELAAFKRADERLGFYRDVVLPQAAQNAQTALRGYQSQTAQFMQLLQARQMELESKMEALRLLANRALAQVNLLYLAGDGV